MLTATCYVERATTEISIWWPPTSGQLATPTTCGWPTTVQSVHNHRWSSGENRGSMNCPAGWSRSGARLLHTLTYIWWRQTCFCHPAPSPAPSPQAPYHQRATTRWSVVCTPKNMMVVACRQCWLHPESVASLPDSMSLLPRHTPTTRPSCLTAERVNSLSVIYTCLYVGRHQCGCIYR